MFVHCSPLFLINHPSIWVELVCILTEDLFVLVNDVRIDTQDNLRYISTILLAKVL